jgi:hypothetical protein
MGVSGVVRSLLEAVDGFRFKEEREEALKGLKGLHTAVPFEWE